MRHTCMPAFPNNNKMKKTEKGKGKRNTYADSASAASASLRSAFLRFRLSLSSFARSACLTMNFW